MQKRLKKAIDEKLSVNPRKYLIPLAGNQAGLYKFRAGYYWLLCSKDDEKLVILGVKVKHRREVYRG